MGDALHVAGGITSAKEARIAQAGLLAVQTSALDARTGVLLAPGSTALVTGTASTSPMTVSIAAHHWLTTRGAANGPYLGALEAATTVSIAAAPGSGTRIDVIYVKQGDADGTVASPDATSAPIYDKVTGTAGAGKPSLSGIVGAEELATVAVSAGATSTSGANVVITNTARQTVARGAPIPCRNQAERDSLTTYPGLHVTRLDLGGVIQQWITGTTWASHVTDADVAKTTGSLTFASGWGAFGSYYPPGYHLSSDGKVTLRGMFARTGASVSLGIGTPMSIGTLPAGLVPSSTVSPISYVGLASPAGTYPARIYIPGGSTSLQVVGMDSGSGTFVQNVGFVNVDGISWYL